MGCSGLAQTAQPNLPNNPARSEPSVETSSFKRMWVLYVKSVKTQGEGVVVGGLIPHQI